MHPGPHSPETNAACQIDQPVQGFCGLGGHPGEHPAKPHLFRLGHGLAEKVPGHINESHVQAEQQQAIHPPGATGEKGFATGNQFHGCFKLAAVPDVRQQTSIALFCGETVLRCRSVSRWSALRVHFFSDRDCLIRPDLPLRILQQSIAAGFRTSLSIAHSCNRASIRCLQNLFASASGLSLQTDCCCARELFN